MPIRCALYARYSSDQQRPESIADQIRHCRQEAARHPDWLILDEHVYTDEAISAASLEGRLGLARLVQAALSTPRPFDLVVIDDTSRLSRDVVDTVQQFRELRFHGIDLYFVNQGLHSGRDNAEFLLAIYGAMDSEYIRELGRKTHRGLEGQARHGLSAGGIAFGYRREPLYDAARLDRDGQPRRLGVRWVVEPAEADIIRTIFRWYAEGRGLHVIAGLLNARGVPSPRQAKGHRLRRDSVGPGWDLSAVRVILGNELYRGQLIWNRSRWARVPGSRRRHRMMRPESEWVVIERPELRIVDEALWTRVQTRRHEIRACFTDRAQFGKARRAYGTHWLSGRLACAECGGWLSIRTGQPQRYGCTRHWRRGRTACANNVLVRRDLAELRISELLKTRLYTPQGVAQLVEAVNARLRARQPGLAAERERVRAELRQVQQRFEGVRRFIEQGDGSAKVRAWLGELERKEARLQGTLQALDAEADRSPLRVHPRKVEPYLANLHATLGKGGPRVRALIQEDLERVVVHPVRPKTGKPFARAEVIASGKGLLGGVTFMVAGAGFEPATFGL